MRPASRSTAGIFTDLARVPELAGTLEQQGYDACWTGETNHDPFLPLLLAAEHTSRLELGTNIAVAFARNPMIVANVGWDLQTYSQGRFILGLGTQIQPHIEKRFSMPWSHPAAPDARIRAALHAIWSAWKDGTRLRFEGEFYTHKIMTPMFTPEPQPLSGAQDLHCRRRRSDDRDVRRGRRRPTGPCVHDEALSHEVTLPAVQRGLERARS